MNSHRILRKNGQFFCKKCGVRWPCLAAHLEAIRALLNTTPREALSVAEWHDYGAELARGLAENQAQKKPPAGPAEGFWGDGRIATGEAAIRRQV